MNVQSPMFSKTWNPDGKVRAFFGVHTTLRDGQQHVYITGGSAGLGLSVAQLLTKKGAHVSIVARNEEKLNKALATLEVSFLSLVLSTKCRSFS